MAKKMLKKSNKIMLLKVLFWAMLLLVLGTVVIPFTPLAANAPALWVDIHGFFVDVRANTVDYATFFGLAIAIIFVLVYLFKKYIIK